MILYVNLLRVESLSSFTRLSYWTCRWSLNFFFAVHFHLSPLLVSSICQSTMLLSHFRCWCCFLYSLKTTRELARADEKLETLKGNEINIGKHGTALTREKGMADLGIKLKQRVMIKWNLFQFCIREGTAEELRSIVMQRQEGNRIGRLKISSHLSFKLPRSGFHRFLTQFTINLVRYFGFQRSFVPVLHDARDARASQVLKGERRKIILIIQTLSRFLISWTRRASGERVSSLMFHCLNEQKPADLFFSDFIACHNSQPSFFSSPTWSTLLLLSGIIKSADMKYNTVESRNQTLNLDCFSKFLIIYFRLSMNKLKQLKFENLSRHLSWDEIAAF